MTSSENMEEVLQLIGAEPNTIKMVLDAALMISIQEDIDIGWWFRTEYCFTGKNRYSYKTRAYKMTSNKLYLGKERPESMDDWDKR